MLLRSGSFLGKRRMLANKVLIVATCGTEWWRLQGTEMDSTIHLRRVSREIFTPSR